MPVYEYRCGNGHEFEVLQRMSDDPVTECSVCRASVQRVFHAPAIHFKGSGFYNTDYGKRKGGPASDGGEARSDGAKPDGPKADTPKRDGASKADSGGSSGPAKASEKAAS
jgi:putative FmdB family regulatory protein